MKFKQAHRDKIPDVDTAFRLCVARPVSKKEAEVTPEAMAAMDKEWDKLEKQNAWLLDEVREWRDVSAEAKARQAKNKNDIIHIGRVFGILVEKGSELPKGNPARKFKGRVVFQGNNVRDQYGDWALFEELSSAPATIDAGKAVMDASLVMTANRPMEHLHIRRLYLEAGKPGSDYLANVGRKAGQVNS